MCAAASQVTTVSGADSSPLTYLPLRACNVWGGLWAVGLPSLSGEPSAGHGLRGFTGERPPSGVAPSVCRW